MNGKIWIPLISLFLALAGSYLTAQVSVTEKLGNKVDRQELKDAVRDSRDQIQREMNDMKKRTDEIYYQQMETNRLLRQLTTKRWGRNE